LEERTFDDLALKWTSEAKQALREVPSGYQRRRAKAQIEKTARVQKLPTITRDLVLSVVGEVIESTQNLEERGRLPKDRDNLSKPAATVSGEQELVKDGDFSWTEEAWKRLQRVPEGFMRDGSKKRMQDCAQKHNTNVITIEIVEEGIKEGLKVMEEMIRKQAEGKAKDE
jgi:hypothetical protein